jgi:predicted NAD-dependent protein-ADP-ribosyltransferase YbiA (DUF1768 family)
MVKSQLYPDKINYNENKTVDEADVGQSSSIYDVNLFGKPIQIGIGKEKHTYSAHNVVYFSIYLMINDEVKSRIGVVEFPSNKLIESLDEDGDIMLEKGKVLYFITKDYLHKMIAETKKNSPAEPEQPDQSMHLEEPNVNISDDVIVLDEPASDSTIVLDDETDDVMKLKIDESKKTSVAKINDATLEDGIFEEIPGFEMPDMLPEETNEMSAKNKQSYSVTTKHKWIAKFMKNGNYDIVDNEGCGDCFFAVIRDAFANVGKKTTVAKLRAILSDAVTENVFKEYRSLYNAFNGQHQELENILKILKKTSNTLKGRSEKSKDKAETKQILTEANSVVEKYKQTTIDKKAAKLLLNEFEYMKDIRTVEDFKAFVKTSGFWADTWAISTLERSLNIKIVLMSSRSYQAGDLDSVINCGQLNDSDIERQGQFKPDYYIMAEYTGSHYKLITYKEKHILKFSEVPYDIKALIINKCMERNAGPYYLIQDFRNMKLKLGLDANEGEPQESDDDYIHNELYDANIVFMFHAQSNSAPRPGKGSGEHMTDNIAFEYNKLHNMADWRRKLDDAWSVPFTVDDKRWNSVEHYYLGSQFKKGFPDFYKKFSLDSDSEMSKDISLARIAGGKTGKSKDNVLREKHITIDSDFYEVSENPRNKMERNVALIAKFNQNLDLKQMLLETKRAKLLHFIRGKEPEIDIALMKLRAEIVNP